MPGSNLNGPSEMRDAVFFEGPDVGSKTSRFWILLVLAAVIASSGVIGDSEATVIGAMIVAPLRVPILGSMLAIVLGDRRNLFRSVALVIGGAAAVVGVGYVMALFALNETLIINSSQLDTWSQAGLIDLVGALAVGVVGSIALVRRDIADTLPGVAIAISLVPPLTVVGISLRVGLGEQAWGAFLLFGTNVTAILGVGVVMMGLYRVGRFGGSSPRSTVDDRSINRRDAYLVIAVSLLVIFTILAGRSATIAKETREESTVGDVATAWADGNAWDLVRVSTQNDGTILVRFEGPTPIPPTDELEADLTAAGIDVSTVEVDFVPRERVTFGADD